MGTILASVIIDAAHELAQDEAPDEADQTWTTTQALHWLNEGQLAICSLKPDAKTINHAIQLAPGTKQMITGRQLLSVIRNMGNDGTTPGRAIRLVDRGIKDESDPDWHSATVATVVKEYVMDDDDEQNFYVSPPVHASTPVYAEVLEALNPTNVPDTTAPIDIDDIYAPPLIEWIMYRFFGRDSEVTPNFVRANNYLQNFYNLLQVKAKVDRTYSPKTRDQLA